MKPVFLLPFLLIFQVSISNGQTKYFTDSSVTFIPHWKKAETHSLSIISSTEEFADGRVDKSSSRFNARFIVLEKDTGGYTIKLSLTGRFKELINYEDLKSAFDHIIDPLISGSAKDQVRNLGFKGVKQMMTSSKSFEIILLKQVKFYMLSFGYKYKTNYIQTNQLLFPNAMGGKPFDATEKLQLTELDTIKAVCSIERTSHINDKTDLRNQILSYLQNVAKIDSATIQHRFADTEFEFSEKSIQQINYLKGIPQKTNFIRVVNFGFENRTSRLDIETIE
jgi:hypothetical protein